MYEEHRLVSALRSVARLDATAIVDYLVNDVNVFGAGSDPEDDQTLLVTGLMA
jgi:serine phosphatase RsbU (regulator of sigma subunit)